MSLVNDMLRDLDARRRDAPTQGLGAEKLVPASDRARKKRRVRPGIIALVLAVVFVGLVALYLVMMSSGGGQITSPLQRVPMAESPASQDMSMPEPELIAQAAAAAAQTAAQTVAQVANETLSQLEQRLQQLETQNRALLASQQREQSIAASLTQGAASNSIVQEYSSASSPQTESYNQEWADAPALPAEELQALANSSTSPGNIVAVESTSSRSPRELSFQDRERQQVQLALQQWASGQQLTALQTLDSFAYEYPDAHTARETLAKLLIQQGETERAMQAVELGLALSPNNNAYRKVKARLLVSDARSAEAVMLLTNMAPAVSADTEYHDLLASSFMANQQYEFAAQTYRTLLQQNASEGRWWYGLAAAFDVQGLSQDAASAYERALQQANLTAGLRQTSQQRLQLIRQSSAAR